MRADVETTGYLCKGAWKVYDPPLGKDTLEQADCSQQVVFLIYEPNDVQTHLAELQRKVNDLRGWRLAALVGDNWIINCGEQENACRTIQQGTGGELVITEPTS
jgi:hypothetical protein